MVAQMTMRRVTFAAIGLRMTHLAMCAVLVAQMTHRATFAAQTMRRVMFAVATAPTMPDVAGSA